MAAAAGHYYSDGGRATKRQKTDGDGMATVLSFYSACCISTRLALDLIFSRKMHFSFIQHVMLQG